MTQRANLISDGHQHEYVNGVCVHCWAYDGYSEIIMHPRRTAHMVFEKKLTIRDRLAILFGRHPSDD